MVTSRCDNLAAWRYTGFDAAFLRLDEGDVGGTVGFVVLAAVFVALGFVDANSEAVVGAIVMGDASGGGGAIGVLDAIFDTAVPALELKKALLAAFLVALLSGGALGSHAERIGIVASTGRGGG